MHLRPGFDHIDDPVQANGFTGPADDRVDVGNPFDPQGEPSKLLEGNGQHAGHPSWLITPNDIVDLILGKLQQMRFSVCYLATAGATRSPFSRIHVGDPPRLFSAPPLRRPASTPPHARGLPQKRADRHDKQLSRRGSVALTGTRVVIYVGRG